MYLKEIKLFPQIYPTDQHYPFNLDVMRRTTSLKLPTPVVFLAGENGCGKSTFLEAVAQQCGIHIWRPEERTRYQYNPYEGQLYKFIRVKWSDGPIPGAFFSSEIFKNFAQNLDEWAATDPGQLKYFGGKSLLVQSHGQSLMSYFRSRYSIKGLYILDEPETALSPKSQLELLKILIANSRAGHAQFIIATHSPLLLACPQATIYSFDCAPIEPIEYRDTDYYRIYKAFLDDPENFAAESR